MCKVCGCHEGFFASGFCPNLKDIEEYEKQKKDKFSVCTKCNYAFWYGTMSRIPGCAMFDHFSDNLANIMYSSRRFD